MAGESFIDGEIAIQRALNKALIEAFETEGGDLDAPREVDFSFYAGSREDAASLVRDLESRGFQAETGDETKEGTWSVHATLQASVNAVTDERFVEDLVRLAAKYLAEFDGWGAAI